MKVTVCVECKGSKSGNLKSNRRIVDKAPWAEVVIRRVIKTAAQKLAGATLSHGYRAPNISASSGQAEMWTLTDSITQLTASRASSNHQIIKRSTRVTSWTDMPRLRPGQEGGCLPEARVIRHTDRELYATDSPCVGSVAPALRDSEVLQDSAFPVQLQEHEITSRHASLTILLVLLV